MSIKTKYKISSVITLLLLTIVSVSLLSCQKNKMYQEYESYGKGYDDAKEGKSKPSIWANKAEKEGYKQGIKDLKAGNSEVSRIEFKYTEEEIKALQYNGSSFEEILNAAIDGDTNAMFSMGLCYLFGGKGVPIELEKSNMFFSKAASLGHAPSLEKVRFIYLEDDPNPFLHQVYLNLIIAMGHTEYTQEYHRIRKEWIEKLDRIGANGNAVVKEIERISEEKLMLIYDNIKTFNSAKKDRNTKQFLLRLNDIRALDKRYDMSYWLLVSIERREYGYLFSK